MGCCSHPAPCPAPASRAGSNLGCAGITSPHPAPGGAWPGMRSGFQGITSSCVPCRGFQLAPGWVLPRGCRATALSCAGRVLRLPNPSLTLTQLGVPCLKQAGIILPAAPCTSPLGSCWQGVCIVPNPARSPQMWLSPSLHRGETEARGPAVPGEPPRWCHTPVPILAGWGRPRCRVAVPGRGAPAAPGGEQRCPLPAGAPRLPAPSAPARAEFA